MRLKSTLPLAFILLTLFCFSQGINAQDEPQQQPPSEFWKKVRFGGGLGLNFGNGNTQIAVQPSAIYQPNEYISFGPAINFQYQKFGDVKTTLYGLSAIVLGNPIPAIQLSAELEQLRVNQRFDSLLNIPDDDFWNTALFVGGGYRMGNRNGGGVTIGARYNVLFKDGDSIYAEAWQPFVRVYF